MRTNGEVGRRTWLERAIHGLGGLIALALGGTAGTYVMGDKRALSHRGWIEAADLERLAVGAPEEVVFRRTRVDGWKITSEKQTAWLVRLGEKEVAAYSPQCTHLGCAYRYDERKKQFICPCHTSNFSLSGQVLSGPAPRPLDRFQVRVDGTRVLLGDLAEPGKEA